MQCVRPRTAADGHVFRIRDGMQDVSVRTIGPEQIKGRERGNAVIVAHADGFESTLLPSAAGQRPC